MEELLDYILSENFDYEECFKKLKKENNIFLNIKLNRNFKTDGLLDYEELRLYGYRKLTLPKCKEALIKTAKEHIQEIIGFYEVFTRYDNE